MIKYVTVPYQFDAHRWGAALRRRREELDMSQDEVGQLLGVTSSAISRWENGRGDPLMSNFLSACNLFDLSPSVYFGLEG